MSDPVIYTLCLTNLLLVAGILISQNMARRDIKGAANGVAEFYAKIHEQSFRHYEYDKNTLRGELEKAHSRILSARSRPPLLPSRTAPSAEPPAPRAPSTAPNSNGRLARERDFATPTGVG